jgi:hypothetical protein
VRRETLDHGAILNLAAKYLARKAGARLSDCTEASRFPVVDSYRAGGDAEEEYLLNRVTFLWRADSTEDNRPVSIVGSFDNLWDATPLETVLFDGGATPYRAATVQVPKGQVHVYKLLLDGQAVLDPINPQRTVLDNGIEWSRFFTQQCAIPISFENWEELMLFMFGGYD